MGSASFLARASFTACATDFLAGAAFSVLAAFGSATASETALAAASAILPAFSTAVLTTAAATLTASVAASLKLSAAALTSAAALAADALAFGFGLRVTSSINQNWLSPFWSPQIWSSAPFWVFMATRSRHLPDRLLLILTRPSCTGSTTQSWLLACAPSH